MRAADGENSDAVRIPLGAGANVHVVDESGKTALSWGPRDEEVIRLLLSAGSVVNRQDHNGRTPLIHAVQYGVPGAVGLLLQAGADVHHIDNDGQTPLDWARLRGHESTIKLLEEYERMLMASDL